MKTLGQSRIVMQNPDSLHRYFAWPTIARLKNGRIVIGASGYRLAHVCPFGKAVLAFSDDEGTTFTQPVPVIDTSLDDRDTGLTPFGDSSLIVTSFNNTRAFQRQSAIDQANVNTDHSKTDYSLAYLSLVTDEMEKRDLGSTFRISHDNGITFGPLYHSPVTSPHGPLELHDGTILWIGRSFIPHPALEHDPGAVLCSEMDPMTGEMTIRGAIENIPCEGAENDCLFSCEPHTIELPDGTLLCHIRVQLRKPRRVFTIYQSTSKDQGKTWSTPVPLLDELGGSPPHLMIHSSGTIVCTYGYREQPFGIRVMTSVDNAATWQYQGAIYENPLTEDLGYPATIELKDGSLLTVFYAHPTDRSGSNILVQNWEL